MRRRTPASRVVYSDRPAPARVTLQAILIDLIRAALAPTKPVLCVITPPALRAAQKVLMQSMLTARILVTGSLAQTRHRLHRDATIAAMITP